MNKTDTPETADAAPEQEPKYFQFMFLLKLHYEVQHGKKKEIRMREMNVLMSSPYPDVTRATLDRAMKAGMSRLYAEKKIGANQVKDTLITNIAMLGHMTESDFLGLANEKSEAEETVA